jgi:TaqI-like C-terminal specificity domain/Eco57I restriction-modification methylase
MVVTLELQESIKYSLQNLRNLNSLKKLFWSELNYERENKELSRRTLTDAVTNEIEGEPLLLASGGANKAFHVIYTRLKSENLSRQGERVVVNHLLQEHPYTLFVFSNKSQSHWHFLNVKYDSSPQKRRLFRRISVGQGEQLRTATERISLLDLERISPTAAPLDIQTVHDEAFDVEAVTQEFFKEYRRTFEKVEGLIQGIGGDERKRLFTQKLFNRLMFIAFIEKKGWLKFQGSTDYLTAFWQSYQTDEETPNKNFYRDRLSHLFFSGLNNPQEQDIAGINNGGFLKELIGSVPYLNGGLFEQDDDDKNPKIIVPDDCIDTILHDLFQRFAFTVTESTPLDVEVAVDPEMLGKVFEELVTGRHESGSYYTPKPIVSFMCREALKGYLKTKVTNESHDTVAEFVDEHNPDNLVNPEAILEALRSVKCCDLAAGSGAYLLGMLHELLDLRQSLFASKGLDSNTVYQRKLDIIENNLYGVDKDVFAVNIARLRLWLSLAVEYQGKKPNPLPNLKYKIEIGDSLIAPSPANTGMIRSELIDQYRQKKAEYMRTHEGGRKQKLEHEINELKTQIALVTHGNIKLQGFDWSLEFAEVFVDGGFDILVSNPPYVRHELIRNIKPTLKNIYPYIYTGKSDLYCFFYARALKLLKKGGMLAFISSNKWFWAEYGENLRKYISDNYQIHSITDFGDLPLFQNVTAYPSIFIVQNKSCSESSITFTRIQSLQPPYPDILTIIKETGQDLPKYSLKGVNWILTDSLSANIIQKMKSTGVPLSNYLGKRIFSGIKTGFNEAFVINEEQRLKLVKENPKSAEIIKPLITGTDVKRWLCKKSKKWLIFTHIGVDISQYPAIYKHLEAWRTQLENRSDQGNNWWELRPCAYYSFFDEPKIIYSQIMENPSFAYDEAGLLTNQKCFFIPNADYYLAGILNSSYIWRLITESSPPLRGGYSEPRKELMLSLPIPKASSNEYEAISKLVKKCLDAKGVACEAWEKEIDERVATLYGL